MALMKEDTRQSIEPLFLSQALESGARLRVGQMNKTEYEGVIRDVGRYDINVEENGRVVTLLKQEISYITSPNPLISAPSPLQTADPSAQPSSAPEAPPLRPNIQQEFLDKAIKENQMLTIFLVNGQRIKASVEAYDNFTILLREGEKQHLYYKHSITTINR
jgi:host factor-I protein